MRLGDLRESYPLSSEWKEPTLFADTTRIDGVPIHVVGLCCESEFGETAFGSAGDLTRPPLERAYFELVERASIVAFERSDRSPASPDSTRWRFARSNGVAAGSSWREACDRAEWELIERDRILRSWYGEGIPHRADLPADGLPSGLHSAYSFEVYLFGDPTSSIEVAGVFGFPRRIEAPLLSGFAARPQADDAIRAALGECIQRLGFLWGEGIPSEEPAPAPTPEFHQEFFLWPPAHPRLRRWLDGEHYAFAGADLALPRPSGADRSFVDMTPPELETKLFVAKAVPDGEMALVFGAGRPGFDDLPEELRIHPIS